MHSRHANLPQVSPHEQSSVAPIAGNGIIGSQDRSPSDGHISTPTNAAAKTLSPISSNTMNSLQMVTSLHLGVGNGSGLQAVSTPPKVSLDSEGADKSTTNENNEMQSISPQIRIPTSSWINGMGNLSPTPPERSPLTRNGSFLSSVRLVSTEFGPTRTYQGIPIAEDSTARSSVTSPQQWSSAVGRANLGKSGRVIERLMGENDMLKRDLQIERLRAEEAKQAMKMTESKMEALSADYEGRLHDAAVNKSLLKRRERQLADLKGQIDSERDRADAAVERERGWREAMDKMELETKQKIDEASSFAAMMDGRNKILATHWREQGDLLASSVAQFREEIGDIHQEKLDDCKRMDMLQELCSKQREELSSLEEERRRIAQAFETYKTEQENLLHSIKSKARDQLEANEKALEETTKALHELKWALGIQENIRKNN